ncbi:DUF5133 domain-containing protein [Streptomyces sp. HUCO-GS316]|uniref:DUF5133 domain-containing protein n=1 Tax=Streptomyces sp. HUCO-GS316 TaxID=2692198 RepID=UPI0013711BD7|nr:DUF5133 domain-containing protein [Streptomyces sp. HUCO-GS316]MXM66076.1 DUF5133 domain-containing protein [Streptomyces sp. HUCO-GS316]
MLIPHSGLLRRLVDEYEALEAEEATGPASGPGRRARDLAYTLCVATGTREVGRALDVAHRLLDATGTPASERAASAD